MNNQTLAISFDDIATAAQRIAGFAHKTPVATSRTADELAGARLFFKCENLQRMGAFKFRGAFNAIAALDDQQRKRGVMAFSSGNHAQAMALAARLLGTSACIVMPADAPPAKLAATRGYGAEVITYDRFREDREAISQRIAGERGLTLIPPYDHRDVMAGAGTCAKELIEEAGELDYLFVCTGGGGLLSGCAVATKALSPRCKIIGVEPEAGNDVQQSFAKGEPVSIDVPKTIADGAQTQRVGNLTFPVIQALVSQIVTASDAQLIRTMQFFAQRMKLVVEPTGCLAAAAVLERVVDVKGARVGVILSGGNVDMQKYAGWLAATGA
jgi:threo-3-hydroxy-L-aspartate ammonia-lyase